MGINIPQLNSCCCFSLRTGAIIVGSLRLFVYILYLVGTLIYRLRLSIEDHHERYYVWMTDILLGYAEIIQLVFCAILIFGVAKEKSSFVTAWILTEITRILDALWNTILISIWYFHLEFFIEEIILLAEGFLGLWVIYSYYRTMPKSKYIL